MAQIPHAEHGPVCPLHKEDVSNVCHKCPWWSRVIGKNPQSDEMIDDWRCAIALLPMLLIEGAQQTRQAGAAVETLRNEMVAGIVDAVGLAAESAGRLLDARHDHRR
jgi:hypothetical protein